MKNIAFLFTLVFLLIGGILLAQSKPERFSEKAPGFHPGPIQYAEDEYDLQFEYPCAVATGEAGVETDGNYIYTTLWNGNEICKYEMNGAFVGTFECASGICDLAWDGTYFYGAAANTTVFEMDFESQIVVSTFTAPVDTRAIAYDEGEDGFWANNWSTDPAMYDRSGAILNSFSINGDEQFYGFAWIDGLSGTCLWGFSQSGSGNVLKKYDLYSGTWLEDFDMMAILSMPVPGDIAGGLFSHPNIIPGIWTLGGLVQNVCIWGIENTWYIYPENDVQVQTIAQPVSGVNLTNAEPISIIIKNNGTNTQSDIPYDVAWDDGFYADTLPGPLAWGESVEITLPETIDMTEYKDYMIVACTYLEGDEYPENDCKTKVITCMEPFLCIDGLYTSGCDFGDGITSWELSDVSIPDIQCDGVPYTWYHDYTDFLHLFMPGMTYTLKVEVGYDDTYFDIWIDYNDDLFHDDDELLLDDAICKSANTLYFFDVTIPTNAPFGDHILRVRTNWQATVDGSCDVYSYGNVCDFKANTGHDHYAHIEVNPISIEEILEPDQTSTQFLTISNIATCEALTYNISLNLLNSQPTKQKLIPNGYQTSHIERIEKVRPSGYSEAAPGFTPGPIQHTDDPYDLQFEYPCAVATGEAGVETDGYYIYTTLWNGTEFCRYEMDGTYVENFTCGSAAAVRDLAYDGTYFYGGAAGTTVWEMDFDSQQVISTITAPVAVRAIAYDEGEDGFWANNWSDTPTLFDRNGAVLNSFSINGDESFYGFAFMDISIGVALFGNSQSGSGNLIKKYSLPDGTWVEDFDMMNILSMPVAGDIGGGLYFSPDVICGKWTLGGIVQNVCLWGVEMGTGYTCFDAGVTQIIEPSSGVNLTSSEEIRIEIANTGNVTLWDGIPYTVTWDNGYYEGLVEGPIQNGQVLDVLLPITANLSSYGDYTFEACTNLEYDDVPGNDCITKVVENSAALCIDGLYTIGCSSGDGLVSWNFANINVSNIPCSGPIYDWYHDYTDQVHEFTSGSYYTLEVKAANYFTHFDVWIDYNNDNYFDNSELILDEGFCLFENTVYQFNVFIPEVATPGEHLLRFRTNRDSLVNESCETYEKGNCCDFSVNITDGMGGNWMTASPLNGTIFPGNLDTITMSFSSMDLLPGEYHAELIINNNSWNMPELTVPVMLTVNGNIEDPIISVEPNSLSFEVYADSSAMDILQVSNVGGDTLSYSTEIEYISGPSIEDWLSLNPGSGSLTAGQAITTDVTVDAIGLEEGTYLANINIASNDPITPIFVMPITLIVVDNNQTPEILVSPDSIEFELYPDSITEGSFLITSLEPENLNLELTVQYLQEKGIYKGSWIGIVSSGIFIPPYSTVDVLFPVFATGLLPGNYYARILINTIEPLIPIDTISISLTVKDDCPLPPPTNLTAEEIEPFTVFLTWESPENEFLYYNVYRDTLMIATEISQTQYIDNSVSPGNPEYVVSAVYEACESFSDTLSGFIVTQILEQSGSGIAIFPNPAGESVNILSWKMITKIIIFDNSGQLIIERNIQDYQTQINTSSLTSGLYFIKIETKAGTTLKKLVVD